jgi:Mrp family chromosome partitioning ATPase/uncharacterized protein involved in exopolysaccharide biosynthesis
VVDTSAIDQVEARSGPASESVINSEVEILTSWDLATEVASAVGVERLLSSPTSTERFWPRSERRGGVAEAARDIRTSLTVTSLRGTNIILVTYKNSDPALATLVLKQLVTRYFTKHLEVHRSADAFNFVSQQSDEVKARLNRTEDELRRLKDEAGITSLPESTTILNADLARTREALQLAETEHVEQVALVQGLEKSVAMQDESLQKAQSPIESNQTVQQYHALLERLQNLREMQIALFSRPPQTLDQRGALNETQPSRPLDDSQRDQQIVGQTTEPVTARNRPLRFTGNERDMAQALAREWYRRQNDTGFAYQSGKKDFDTLVKEAELQILGQRNREVRDARESEAQLLKLNQEQIAGLEKQRSEMEQRYPGIAATVPIAPTQTGQLDLSAEHTRVMTERARLATERARLSGIEARKDILGTRLNDLRTQATRLSELGPQIQQLERTKEIEENNYKYFQASLEKARVDELLDPSKMPNISVVQSPSTAFTTTRNAKKLVLGLAFGGLAAGLVLALLIELVLDRSVKRPLELERLLGAPLLLYIPYLNGRRPLRLRWPRLTNDSIVALNRNGPPHPAPWDSEHFIRPFSEAIRDRLILFFEFNHMNHKPKLVAVTGCSKGAGSSTIAAGLAAALSETGDGKVLLVDMNVGRPEAHPFFRGSPACSLSEALVGEPSPAGENLYLAVASPPGSRHAQIIPKRFYDLMPHLKASDFDYIIFDMPPLNQTSITLSTARYMDKVILVAESGRSNAQVVKRAYAELTAVNANVSAIVNKLHSYVPKWLAIEG